MTSQQVKLGIYQHYKGKRYRVMGVARYSETLEEMVVYQALYDSPEFGKDSIWVRPLSMFKQSVEVDGQPVPRFKFIKSA